MKITTLVNAVSTQNASGAVTNATQTAFSATTSAYAIEVQVLSPSGQVSAQTPYRVWFSNSSINVTASTFARECGNPKAVDLVPKPMNNGTTIAISDAVAAMGTYAYCWVEMPSITAANGTISVFLIEMN